MIYLLYLVVIAVVWFLCAVISLHIYEDWLNNYVGDDTGFIVLAPFAFIFVSTIALSKGILFLIKLAGEKLIKHIDSHGGVANIFSPSRRKLYKMEQDYNEVIKLIEYQPKPDSYWKIKELEWELNSK